MQAIRLYSPLRRVWRVSWTLLTYVLGLPAILVAGLAGALIGLVKGLIGIKRFGYFFRASLLNTLLRVMGPILRFSTRLYNTIFGTQLFEQIPLPKPTHEFYVVGHRGSPSKCCENTLFSYECALKEGANAIEIDLCFCADGEVVIWHDWDPDGMVALFRENGLEALQRYRPVYGNPPFRRPVPHLTLAELRTHCSYAEIADGLPKDPPDRLHIPTYRELLEWGTGQKRLKRVFLDMKIPPNGLQYVEPMMRKMIADFDAVCPSFEVVFMTIYPDVLTQMRQHFPEQLYCFDKEITNTFTTISAEMVRGYSPILDAERLRHRIGSVGRPTFMTLGPWEIYQSVLIHDLQYRKEKQLAVELIAWTVNDPDEQKWLVEAGVDGILTDVPGTLASKVLSRKALQTMKCPVRLLKRQRILARPVSMVAPQ